MSAGTSVNYKKKLIVASELRTKGREALHERVSLLVAVFEDREFRSDNQQFDDIKAAELLDSYLEDTALSFLEARAVLQTYPKFDQWTGKTVRELYESALESSRLSDDSKPRATPRRVTIKMFEEEQLGRREAESEGRQLKKKLSDLEAENKQLTRDLAKAEGRISELERIVRRELVN